MLARSPVPAALLAAMCGLTACAPGLPPYDPATYSYSFLEAEAYRAYAQSYSETPFALGSMDIVATEGDNLRTFRLVPCRNGTAICSGSARGQAGTLTRSPDYWIVRGLYGGRTFYLSPGGDGAIWYGNNRAVALAWNNIG
jgi:hypothetical protein